MGTTLLAHTPLPSLKENKYLIQTAVATLYEACSKTSPYASQAIYGHLVYLIKKCSNGFALIETEDGYWGYMQMEHLIRDNPRFRTSSNLCRTTSIASLVYPTSNTRWPALLRLPFDSRIELIQDLDTSCDRWLEVRLVDGKKGWIQRGDVEKIRIKSLEEVVQLAYQFQGLPYIWGGNSSEGYDCSGYIQTLIKQMGVILPRDSLSQSVSEETSPAPFPDQPGDLVFFGDQKVSHVGFYLGKEEFIHSGVGDHKAKISIAPLSKGEKPLLVTRRIHPPTFQATISNIDAPLLERMKYSWKGDNPVPLQELRYIRLNHWGFDGCVHEGELVVNKEIALEIVEIFHELFKGQYPIEKMLLIDAYQANDALSCEDNNTSCFCSRFVIGGKNNEWSFHSFGLALDINPLLNPYFRKGVILIGEEFLDRTLSCHGMIHKGDFLYNLFISRGWKWGGEWMEEKGYIDYQHFYKEVFPYMPQ